MRHPIVSATAEVAAGLADRVAALPEGAGPAGRTSVAALLASLVAGTALPASSPLPRAAAERRLAALLGPIAALADPPGVPMAVSSGYLASFVRLAIRRSDMPSDKLSRWLGFAEGSVAARGGALPPGAGPLAGTPDLDELSYRLGFVQACLAVAGTLDVDAERDRTRPIFHAAYAALGLDRPATVEVRA